MNIKRELPNIIIVLIPFIYLAYIYNGLPETVPTHWNWKGEIDDWGKKSTVIMIPFLLPLLTCTFYNHP